MTDQYSATPKTPQQQISPEFIESVRKQMIAFAYNQLSDHHLAEDVVQDALISALQNSNQFKGDAAFKSWVFAILKNKIVDTIRKDSKYTNLSSMHDHEDGSEETLLNALFDDAGFWQKDSMPSQFDNSWSNPEVQADSDGFWQVLEVCLTNLPSDQARAFLMREYMELDTDEICRELDIGNSHYYVLMHRARLRLQTCLSLRWFESTESQA